MREIKFRAWDKHRNKWIDDCDLLMESSGRVYAGDLNNPPLVFIEPENVSLYTGLKDKNGIDIYDGDIVEERWANPLAGGENVDRYKIEFADSTGIYKMVHSSGEERWHRALFLRYREVTVIGNIFEDGELLDDSKNSKEN